MTPRVLDVLVVGGGATGAALLRDLSMRGARCLLVDKGDFGTGTSGRNHGLLHSGARYVVKDEISALQCARENAVLSRVAAPAIEPTGGLFVATPDDPPDYADGFAAACARAGVACREIEPAEALRREPALRPDLRRAFAVSDGAIDPWALIELNLRSAVHYGGEALAYHRLVGLQLANGRIVGAELADVRSGSTFRVAPRMVVNAAGPWAGRVAALAGAEVTLTLGKGALIVLDRRPVDSVVARCHPPSDGDALVPVHTVAILGTSSVTVHDPDRYAISPAEIAHLMALGDQLVPSFSASRVLRAYAGVRPLYLPRLDELQPRERAGLAADPAAAEALAAGRIDSRRLTRAHRVLDHGPRDGIANLVSIVGGKLTTCRLMAEETADTVAAKLGLGTPCRTADEPMGGADGGRPYWLGHRLAEREVAGGGDADLVCECELVSAGDIERFLDERWPCSLDDLRRGTRLGMGPCQGAFCTFRAAARVGERAGGRAATATGERGLLVAAGGPSPVEIGRVADGPEPPEPGDGPIGPALVDAALVGFLEERFRGVRPVAWGRQLQEAWFEAGVYLGVLGVDALVVDGQRPCLPEDGRAEL